MPNFAALRRGAQGYLAERVLGQARCARSTTGGARLRGLLRLLVGDAAERGDEESLVDPAVEDRDAHLHTLRDHLATLHVDFVGELGGRQVYGHSWISSRRFRPRVLSHCADVSMDLVANAGKEGNRPPANAPGRCTDPWRPYICLKAHLARPPPL